jgi:hypothetical protein
MKTTRSPFLPPSALNSDDGQLVTHEHITERARELWLEQGCPTDRDEAIWLEAEAELLATQQGRLRHPRSAT